MKNGTFKRKIVITNAVYSTGNWTLTTQSPHLLAPGDIIPLYDNSADGQATVNATCIAGTTGSTIVFTYAQPLATFVPTVLTDKFPTGFVGNSEVIAVNSGNVLNVQATTTTTSGTGSHGASVQVSNDQIGWITLGTFSATAGASPVTDAVSSSVPWIWARINVTGLTGTGGQTTFSLATERL